MLHCTQLRRHHHHLKWQPSVCSFDHLVLASLVHGVHYVHPQSRILKQSQFEKIPGLGIWGTPELILCRASLYQPDCTDAITHSIVCSPDIMK